MSKLSANTLFHFTPRDFLLDKFENGFSPRYNKEFDPVLDGKFFNNDAGVYSPNAAGEISLDNTDNHPLYIPMVCFCDIPLSSLNFHMDVYSSYGIGLTKEWAEKNRLNPVMYVNESSSFFLTMSNMFEAMEFSQMQFKSEIKKEQEAIQKVGLSSQFTLNLLNLYSQSFSVTKNQIVTHLKPRVCKGKYRDKYTNYSYYDEKEWRYVPHYNGRDPHVLHGAVPEEKLKDLNEFQKKNAITFSPDMVKYIIVENNADVDFVVEGLNEIKSRKGIYTDSDIHLFTTKIITREQIIEDF